MQKELYYLGFSVCPGIGATKVHVLVDYFGDVRTAWYAGEKELVAAGIGKWAANRLVQFRTSFDLAGYAEKLTQAGIDVVVLGENYPHELLSIPRAPFILYTIGDQSLLLDEKKIAVVGTRKMTQYGQRVTQTFTTALVQSGCTIVSGLAIGVDGAAHRAALQNGGRTIAVLGSGVDVCTPMEHYTLYKDIITHGGLIISEAAPGATPVKGSFPARNRIIAGLSKGVLVPEGAIDSGSLITANYAFDFGRKVYAIPGPITSRVSHGPYELIKKGAKLVTDPNEMLADLAIKIVQSQKKTIQTDNKEMQQIINILEEGNTYPDEIIKTLQISSQHLSGMLSLMEMNGWIRYVPTGEIALI